MSLTFSQNRGNGSTLSYSIVAESGYFEDDDITVELIAVADGTITEQVLDTDYTIVDGAVIFTVAPTRNYYVRIRREVTLETTYSDFTRGNAFGPDNLNNSMLKALYQTQQLADGFRPDDHYWKNNTNAGGNKLTNLKDGTDPQDAATYKQLSEAATIPNLAGVVEGYVASSAAVAANTAKVSNVTTNLTYSQTSTTVAVISSDGTDAILPTATTSLAGVMSAAHVNAIAANTAKVSNVTTDLTYSQTSTTVTVKSSDGTDAILPTATTSLAGVMSAAQVTKLNTASASYTAPWI